ncbi:HYR domain-containing protein [Hymenobacter sp. M29]|uniref:HYR domain-containing protein n=1 Tax=Hymenobacter mellowenesis TaxID=3063995 RepID=A0ABT9AIH9_9BACT|nr:HYR domain-containing protein [Hymenobacter sp. M29]MDO7849378.1 HYR domain-containing protein [Hymenobacter sp. M29]
MTWRTVQTDATKRTVQFKVSMAFRRSYFGTPAIGATVNTGVPLMFGHAAVTGSPTSATINLTVTSVDVTADILYGEATITHVYPASIAYTAYFTQCCRITAAVGLMNNAEKDFTVRTVVNAGTGNNSPVSTLTPIVNLSVGQAAASFLLPASDQDGDPLTFSLATAADLALTTATFVNAPGLAVNATTGNVTFNTVGLTIGKLYNAVIKVSDGKTSTLVDFLIKVAPVSNAPIFDYSVTPPNAYVYKVAPGDPIAFTVRATDSDAGDIVTLQAIGLPTSAIMTPALPVSGNPVASSFSWTPTTANLGTTIVNFVAQDAQGVQRNSSVTIRVSQDPVFNVPPTPANGSVFQVTPGTALNYTIQASDPDPTDRVSLVGATGLPSAAVFTPALPTAAANPVTTQLNWTPVLADWGQHAAVFTARDTYGDESTHTLNLIVNSAPSFISTPGTLSVVAGQVFTYDIATTDPDLPYGDELEIETPVLPAWLTLVDNGDGTATLSGTPTVADAGVNPVSLVAADIYHHGASYGLIRQSFDITVIPCNTQLSATGTNVDCNGKSNGSIALAVSGGTAPYSYAWTGPNGYTSAAQSPSGLAAGTYTVTTTDANNCHETTQITLTEPVLELPQISCAASVAVGNDAGACGAVVSYAVPQGTHSCRNVTTTLTAGLASGALFPLGITTVTYTATDDAGNTAACSFTVTVTDTEAPTITAPAALTVSTDAGQCAATGVALGQATAADNCAGVTVTNNAPATFPKGLTTVTYTATDAAGLTATATQVVTVTDTEAPVVVAPAAVTVSADAGQCSASNVTLGTATAGDNCAGVTVTNNAPAVFPKGTTTVRWTATDATGLTATATQVVTVVDAEKPTITAPAARSVSTNPGQCSATQVALGTPTVADNCTGVTVANNAPATFPKGTTTVTWTATDAAGNTANATQVVTVNDTERPVLAALANITANAPATQCGAVVSFSPTATDNCAGATVVASSASGSTFAVGITTVNVTATDASGNTSTGSFTVTVRDVTAPTALAKNVTVTLVNGAASVTPAQVNNGSADACGIASVTLNKTTFTCANIGANPVTLTVTDVHGLVSTASAVVTVTGTVPTPGITVTPAGSVYTGGVATNLYLGYGAQSVTLTATGGVSYAWSPSAGLSNYKAANPTFTASTPGTFTYTVTATNAYGCTATKTVTLRVVDVRCGNNNDKVIVCHNGHEICISPNAVDTHLTGHTGDQLGTCSSAARGVAEAASVAVAAKNELSAFPNPVTENATVAFRTAQDGPAQVLVYNELGQRVATLFDGAATAGQQYSLTLNGQRLTSGLYVCRLVTNGKTETLRLTIVR